MKRDFLLTLYQQSQTVFTLKEISLLFPEISYERLKDRLAYYTKVEKLKRLRKGVYAKENYNPQEIASKLFAPAYISLETVLQKAGLVFQYYKTIFVVSYVSRTVTVDEHILTYRKIKNDILFQTQGIEKQDGVMMATPERAFLDALFLYKNYHFDNLRPLDWDKIKQLQPMYTSKALDQRVKEYYQLSQADHV